jgi:thioredoxin reductase
MPYMTTTAETSNSTDVIVVGGGSAGLSAALMLTRARRSVVVLDGAAPRNATADGIHAFLTRDGMTPAELNQLGRAEVESYGGTVIDADVKKATRTDSGFQIETTDGRMFAARRLVIATGLHDELPDIRGLRERWGKDVIHCPYCHGWEVRDREIGILATGPMAVHQALLFRQWSDRIKLFLNNTVEPTDDEWEKLAARDIEVIEGAVTEITSDATGLTGAVLDGGRTVQIGALALGPRPMARVAAFADLGIVAETHAAGEAFGTHIHADEMGATGVAGVWAAGTVAEPMLQVLPSAAHGAKVGGMVNFDLINEETEQAVQVYRSRAA